jgi:hypothetical protein
MKRLKVNLTNELDLGTCCMHWRIGSIPRHPTLTTHEIRGEERDGPRSRNFFDIAREDKKLSVLSFFLASLIFILRKT